MRHFWLYFTGAFLVASVAFILATNHGAPVVAPFPGQLPSAVQPTAQTETPPTPTVPVPPSPMVMLASPLADATIASPLTVSGKASGTWYFEASFPIEVLDSNGAVIAQAPAQAQGDWMTSDYVPFTATLTFTKKPLSGSKGTIVLMKDNPSGDPAKDDQLSVPIVFQ